MAKRSSSRNGKIKNKPPHPRIGIRELAGVCRYAEAARVGFSVEENVARLKRYNWIEQTLTDLALTHLTATPEWEVKQILSLHTWLDAEHAQSLQNRVAELRHPPHNFHLPPDAALEAFTEEALRSDGTVELLVALYRVLKPALLAAYREHMAKSNKMVDQPTLRFLRFVAQEEEEMIALGGEALRALTQTAAAQKRAAAWEKHLRSYLAAAGGVVGDAAPLGAPLPASRAAQRFAPNFFPRRDQRFESYNFHFPPHWVYAQTDRPARERMLALVCKRLLEMDVPEMMASIIWKTRQEALAAGKPKPWAYTREMCRQLWDEARHSMMGEVWLVNKGVDFTRVPLNVGFSLALNQMVTPRESHAALLWIEQGLMPRTTGKAYEWRTAREAGDALATLFMDYDWADEVLHVQIGHWINEELGSNEQALKLGEEAFSRVMALRREGKLAGAPRVEQREWWPDFCEKVLGFRPEPLSAEVMATQDAPWKSG